MYKLQFQAPPQVGVYTFQLAFVSDTFVGEDVRMFLPVSIESQSLALNLARADCCCVLLAQGGRAYV